MTSERLRLFRYRFRILIRSSRELWSWVGGAVVGGLVLLAFVHLPGVPYNFSELIGADQPIIISVVRLSLIAGAAIGLGVIPAYIARSVFAHRRRLWWMFGGLLIGAAALALVLNIAAPTESIGDVVGAPSIKNRNNEFILRSARRIELVLRLAALLSLPMTMVALGAAWWNRLYDRETRPSLRDMLQLFIPATACMLLGRTVVITWASTDNITELIKNGGGFPAELYLGFMLGIIGFNAGGLAAIGSQRGRTRLFLLLGAIPTTLLAALCAYGLFRLGTVEALEKYRVTFSAAQFLLGANRADKLAPMALIARWYVAYSAIVAVLGFGSSIGRRLGPLTHVTPELDNWSRSS